MRRVALGLLLGTAAVQQLTALPDSAWSLCLFILIPLAFLQSRWRLGIAIAIGFFWASLIGNSWLNDGLLADLEGKDVIVTGKIASLPEISATGQKFHFIPTTLQWQGQDFPPPRKLALTWYKHSLPLAPGEHWQLQVRLKQPHGFMNPGGFDYEAWLFRNGIRARGYVRENSGSPTGVNHQIAKASVADFVGNTRLWLLHRMNRILVDEPSRGLLIALAIGERQAISPTQWDVLIQTGTSHLVAISGLHVGLVAGFAFFLIRALWRRSSGLVARYPANQAAAWGAIGAAIAYSFLAGFSIPTQRAMVMVCVVMAAILLRRRLQATSLLSLAMIVVLMLDPLAVMAPGFWLSFAAIGAIIYGMNQPLAPRSSALSRVWWRWGRVQWVVALGLLPLLVVLFQQASLVAPIANFIAVPWVSFTTVPLTLIGTLLLGVSEPLASWVLQLAALTLDILWRMLEWLGQLSFSQWLPPSPESWAIFAALIGVGWLLLPAGVPARWIGLIWLLPLILLRPEPPGHGQVEISVLDVGQGLSVVARTRQHVLVYDTGPRFPSGFNTGEAVVAPFLRAQGVDTINTLIISHGDTDHAGGVDGLLRHIPAQRLIADDVLSRLTLTPDRCRQGDRWSWDGVEFEILHPVGAHREGDPTASVMMIKQSRNNRSCVLVVRAGRQSVLLTGDIEREAELSLVEEYGKALAADLLIVPHHGSATSSSEVFLNAVDPRLALISSGYRNRFGFPKPEVLDRYRQREIPYFSTAESGALTTTLGAGAEIRISAYRPSASRYWHASLVTE